MTANALPQLNNRTIYQILIAMAGVLCAIYFLEYTVRSHAQAVADLHQSVVNGSAASPYRYRVLSVWVVEALRMPGDAAVSINAAYITAHALIFPAMFISMFRWFARWMADDRAAFSTLVIGMLIPLGLMNWGTSLYTPLEVAFIALACLMAMSSTTTAIRVLYLLLIFSASLNRETGGILALIWIAAHWHERREWLFGGLLIAVWIGVLLGLRAVLGSMPHEYNPQSLWTENTVTWFSYAIRNNLFMVPIWFFIFIRVRSAPDKLKALVVPSLVYLVFSLFFGQWHEIRMQFAALVMIMPVMFAR